MGYTVGQEVEVLGGSNESGDDPAGVTPENPTGKRNPNVDMLKLRIDALSSKVDEQGNSLGEVTGVTIIERTSGPTGIPTGTLYTAGLKLVSGATPIGDWVDATYSRTLDGLVNILSVEHGFTEEQRLYIEFTSPTSGLSLIHI